MTTTTKKYTMAFSMHSHSGQFCPGHAQNSLEEIVLRAISLKMHLLALTEHMPRDQDKDLYPEEISAGCTTAELMPRHAAYIREAQRLRAVYAPRITLLVGFESEWIRAESAGLVRSLMSQQPPGIVDFFVGSVHHVCEIPIDFDRATYEQARDAVGKDGDGNGSDEALFEAYFDAQWDMLRALRPRVVGHFDLIRLFSDQRDAGFAGMDGVWRRIRRNLQLVVEQGGLLEVNSSALRKGLMEPYPARPICQAFMAMGGRFTLSDDSHGIAQVGLNFGRVSDYLESLGVTDLYYLDRQTQETGSPGQESSLIVKKIPFMGLDSASFPTSSPP